MNNDTLNSNVYLVWTDKLYPEFPFHNSNLREALKQLFALWSFDNNNPLQSLIKPGQIALIKPNWVRDYNPLGHNLDSLITHTSLIAHLIDFLAKAMANQGTIIIGDAPLQNCNFKKLIQNSGIEAVIKDAQQKYPEIKFLIEDWRLTTMKKSQSLRIWKIQNELDKLGPNDTHTHRLVDLGKESFFEEVIEYTDRFRVTKYKPSLISRHHASAQHEYLVTNRIFEANLIINLAKMKTHIKAGLTGALKNLVGINGHKEYLPHHIKGSYFEGGDNYCTPSKIKNKYENVYDNYWENFNKLSPFQKVTKSFYLKCLETLGFAGFDKTNAGSWRGNDTVWRTILDLNHLLYFWRPSPSHRIINIVDGIVAGEGEGPLIPEPKKVGLLMGGENPAYIDAAMARLMGYNISRIPTVYHAIYHRKSKFFDSFLEDIRLTSQEPNGSIKEKRFFELPNLHFKKPKYWRGA